MDIYIYICINGDTMGIYNRDSPNPPHVTLHGVFHTANLNHQRDLGRLSRGSPRLGRFLAIPYPIYIYLTNMWMYTVYIVYIVSI